MKKRLQKGSFTVEASMLLPFLIFIIFAFFCLCLYLHDRSVLSSCAAELAGKGAAEKYRSEKELESWLQGQAVGLAKGKLLCLRDYSENSHGELYRQYQSFGRLESERRRTGGSLKPHSKASKSPGDKKDRGKGGVI